MSSAAELRALRALALVLGVGSVLAAALSVETVLREDRLAPAGWTPVAVILVFAVPVVVAVIVQSLSRVAARVALGFSALVYLATAASVLLVLDDSTWTDSPWVLDHVVLGASAAALALPRTAAWLYTVFVGVLVAGERLDASAGGLVAALHHGLYAFACCAVVLALVHLIGGRARGVDEETSATVRQAGAVLAARARNTERAQVDALLHDTVLATLLLASRSGEEVGQAARHQAAQAVAALDPAPQSAAEQEADLVALLEDRIRRLDARIPLEASRGPLLLPAGVAERLTDAAVEAVRNSLQHAGLAPAERPRIRIERRGSGVQLDIEDAGVGFDPDTVPDDRLGLRTSILRRVRSIPGGRAEVESAPGRGTRIRLSWDRSR